MHFSEFLSKTDAYHLIKLELYRYDWLVDYLIKAENEDDEPDISPWKKFFFGSRKRKIATGTTSFMLLLAIIAASIFITLKLDQGKALEYDFYWFAYINYRYTFVYHCKNIIR